MIITPESFGSQTFRQRYGLRYAYYAGAMYKGIASTALVIKMGQAGLMGFLGTGGLKLSVIESAIDTIQAALAKGQSYGMNLLCHLDNPELEMAQVDLFLRKGIYNVEAAAFMQMTPALVRYRLTGLRRNPNGTLHIPHRIIAKISRPEVASAFMSPAPEHIVQNLVSAGLLTEEEAKLSEQIPMAQDICVEADSGGHTDQGVLQVLLPTIRRLADEMQQKYHYADSFQIGAAGGIGTPEAVAAVFLLGADFIVTGSINQCTVEAGTSSAAKDLLQQANIQDMAYAPAGDMFEIGAKVQVLRRGLFFPARANKLYELYQHHSSWDAIEAKTQQQIENKYFQRPFEAVWQETKQYYMATHPDILTKAEQNPKQKLALVFKWYFIHTARLAMKGSDTQRVDYQIHCGPALGALNQWLKGTDLEDWQNRHVDMLAERLMTGAAVWTARYVAQYQNHRDAMQKSQETVAA